MGFGGPLIWPIGRDIHYDKEKEPKTIIKKRKK
jgi:hypothetical protein